MGDKKKKKNKKKTWTKTRHKVVTKLLGGTLGVYCRIKYGIKVEKFKGQEKRPYLILLNHQTGFDQFFVGMAFKGPVYYLATEDIFSMGFVSSVIKYLVAPIPIKKQTTDIRAIMNCMKVAKEGGTIAIAPEGNRTYSGKTVYMSPSIAPLARKFNIPIALYRIEGGYGVQPRWSDVVRKGKMRGYVSRVITPEEYKDMTDDELFAIIKDGLYVNEATCDGLYKHKKSAEYLERAMYFCPTCGLSTFESHNDIIECKKCGMKIKYLPTKELCGVGFDFPYRFVANWYEAQEDYINSLNILENTDNALYKENVELYEVVPYKKKNLLCDRAILSLYGDRIEINASGNNTSYSFDDLSTVTVLGKNKLNIYSGEHIYQIKGDKRFNALKYVNIYHRYKNIKAGEENVKFLGL